MRIALPLPMLTKMTWIVNQLTAVDNTKAKIGMADQSKSMRNNNNCQSGMGATTARLFLVRMSLARLSWSHPRFMQLL